MTALARRRRNRTIVALSVGLCSLAALPGLGWVAADALRTSTEGRDALAGVVPLTTLPATPVALLAGIDEAGEVATLSVLALAPAEDGVSRGGTVVVMPAGGDTYLPDGTRGRVAEAYRQGGLAALKSSVEGLLGVTFEAAAVLDAAELSLVLPVGPVGISLGAGVVDDRDGAPVEAFAAGSTTLDATAIGELLTARSALESEVRRLPAVDAFWRGVATGVGGGLAIDLGAGDLPADPAKVTDPARLSAMLTDLFAGPVQVHTLTAEQVTGTDNPDGVDLLRLDTAEVTVVFATVAFSSVSPPNPTLSIYVRSPLGDPALTRAAVGRLILAGANVVLVTENPEMDLPAWTEVEYVDQNDADEAEQYGAQLGTFTSKRSSIRIDGVDAIMTLGQSFDDKVSNSPLVVTSTTTIPDDDTPPPSETTASTTG